MRVSLFETFVGPNRVLFCLSQKFRPFIIIRGGGMVEARPTHRSAIEEEFKKETSPTDIIALIAEPDKPDKGRHIFMSRTDNGPDV